MTLFKKIVSESLINGTTPNDDMIITAINKMRRMQIRYNDHDEEPVPTYDGLHMADKTKGKNIRYILPVAYGLTKSGKKAIRAYQSAGSTRRGEPHWKLFLVDNIFACSVGNKSFRKYGQQLLDMGLNPDGDKGMTRLFAITPIANSNVQVSNDTNSITSEPMSKDDVSPTSDLQKPSTTDTTEFSSAQTNKNNSIDNTSNNTYFSKKVEAPQTKPITKKDVLPTMNRQHNLRGLNGKYIKDPYNFASEKPQFDINSDEWNHEYDLASQETKPIEKQDINGNNKLTNSYKDMTDRMNNLYKDDEEKEK